MFFCQQWGSIFLPPALVGSKKEMYNFLLKHSFQKNIFIITKYRNSNKSHRKIMKRVIKEAGFYPVIAKKDIIIDENEQQAEQDVRQTITKEDKKEKVEREPEKIEMVIADVPVWLVKSEVITSDAFNEIRRQIEPQLKNIKEKTVQKAHFVQAVLSWEALNPGIPVDEKYLEAFGFDLSTLRDIYGEVNATFQDFIDVALGRKRFKTVEEKNRDAVIYWLQEVKKFDKEKIEFLMIFYDFKKNNPNLTMLQLANSQLIQHRGGLSRIKTVFGSLDNFIRLYETMEKITYLNVDEIKDE